MDVVLAVAEVGGVAEAAAVVLTLVATRATNAVTLLDRAEGGADVFELIVDVQGDFAQTNHQAENSDRRDQDQFSRDNETSFVVLKGVDELEHESIFRSWGLLCVRGECHGR